MGLGRTKKAKRANAEGWTAVVFAAGRVDVACVSRQPGGRPRVESCESYALGSSSAETLTRLKKRYGLNRSRCTTLLVPGSYQMTVMETPVPDAGERLQAIRARLQESVDYPVEHATIDVIKLPGLAQGTGRASMSMVVAASNAVLAPKIRAFQSAGVSLEVIDIPEMAQRNLAALCEEPQRGLVFLGFDDSGGLLTLTADGELYAARRIEITLDAGLASNPERQADVFDRIGLEVQRSLDNFDRQHGAMPINRLVLGPHPVAESLCLFLRDYLSLPVAVMELAAVIDFPNVPELARMDRQAQCLPAIGAALRMEQVE